MAEGWRGKEYCTVRKGGDGGVREGRAKSLFRSVRIAGRATPLFELESWTDYASGFDMMGHTGGSDVKIETRRKVAVMLQ